MAIANTKRVLDSLPFAIGVYGNGPNTNALNVGNAVSIKVNRFEATPDSGFQSALYKDAVTGKYTIAFAGTNDGTDALQSDRVLATANLLTNFSVGTWDPQLTDAIKFTFEAFKQIKADYKTQTGLDASLDDLRKMVTVTGHSLGGSLAELTAKFFGLAGTNIDGPGVAALIGQDQYLELQKMVQVEFPDLKPDYTLNATDFGAYAYTVVGVAGTHLEGIEVQNRPDAHRRASCLKTRETSLSQFLPD